MLNRVLSLRGSKGLRPLKIPAGGSRNTLHRPEEPLVMTQGGPAQRTVTVLYLMYEEGFKWWSLGTGSAVAFVLFLFMFGFTLLQMRAARRWGTA